jgi:hypothetical protein
MISDRNKHVELGTQEDRTAWFALLSSMELICETIEVWQSAVAFWRLKMLCTVSQAYRRNVAAKFDGLQCNRSSVGDSHLQLLGIMIPWKRRSFPRLNLQLFAEALKADCHLAVWSNGVTCVLSWMSWYFCCLAAKRASDAIRRLSDVRCFRCEIQGCWRWKFLGMSHRGYW